ncbi:hypothetical protein Pelo_1983 [Pelomyxa schiedti]|nr:hypothetical protein Pelo_1983 [Pelomyxa schiedti]
MSRTMWTSSAWPPTPTQSRKQPPAAATPTPTRESSTPVVQQGDVSSSAPQSPARPPHTPSLSVSTSAPHAPARPAHTPSLSASSSVPQTPGGTGRATADTGPGGGNERRPPQRGSQGQGAREEASYGVYRGAGSGEGGRGDPGAASWGGASRVTASDVACKACLRTFCSPVFLGCGDTLCRECVRVLVVKKLLTEGFFWSRPPSSSLSNIPSPGSASSPSVPPPCPQNQSRSPRLVEIKCPACLKLVPVLTDVAERGTNPLNLQDDTTAMKFITGNKRVEPQSSVKGEALATEIKSKILPLVAALLSQIASQKKKLKQTKDDTLNEEIKRMTKKFDEHNRRIETFAQEHRRTMAEKLDQRKRALQASINIHKSLFSASPKDPVLQVQRHFRILNTLRGFSSPESKSHFRRSQLEIRDGYEMEFELQSLPKCRYSGPNNSQIAITLNWQLKKEIPSNFNVKLKWMRDTEELSNWEVVKALCIKSPEKNGFTAEPVAVLCKFSATTNPQANKIDLQITPYWEESDYKGRTKVFMGELCFQKLVPLPERAPSVSLFPRSPSLLAPPSSVALERNSDTLSVIFSDPANHCIRRMKQQGGGLSILEFVVGKRTQEGYKNGSIDEAEFRQPHGVAIDSSGNLIVADTYNNCIRKVDFGTGRVTTLAGSPDPGFTNGKRLQAHFKAPSGVAFDSKGDLLVADRGNNAIRKIDLRRDIVSTFIGPEGSFAVVDKLVDPSSICVTPDNDIAFVTHSNKLSMVTQGGIKTLYSSKAKWGRISAVVLDASAQNIILCEKNRILSCEVEPLTTKGGGSAVEIHVLAGDVAKYGSRDGAPAEEALFTNIVGLALDQWGDDLYLGDKSESPTIRVVHGIKALLSSFKVKPKTPAHE